MTIEVQDMTNLCLIAMEMVDSIENSTDNHDKMLECITLKNKHETTKIIRLVCMFSRHSLINFLIKLTIK